MGHGLREEISKFLGMVVEDEHAVTLLFAVAMCHLGHLQIPVAIRRLFDVEEIRAVFGSESLLEKGFVVHINLLSLFGRVAKM